MRHALISILLLVFAPPVRALVLTATVNKDRVALNDQVLLTVRVDLDESASPHPQMPSIPSFNIHSAGRRSRTNIINNQISSSVEYTYVLVPRFVGNAVIPPITVSHKGQTARTKAVPIRVLPADTATPSAPGDPPAPPQGDRASAPAQSERGPDMFMTASLDKTDPFVDEQVLLTVKFYLGAPTQGDAEYEFPDTHGFTRETLDPIRPRTVGMRGRQYQMHEIRTALFPIKSGKLTIGPTKISALIQTQVNMDAEGPDFFRLFFAQSPVRLQQRRVMSDPITLQVRPLPEGGKPPDFSGAVGHFKIHADIEPTHAKVGEAVTLTVTLEGRGNIKTIGDLTLPEMDSFRIYETVSSLDVKPDPDGIRGKKEYKTVLVPRVSGTLTIPPVPLIYFDLEKREYLGIQTHSIKMKVAPGDAAAPPVGFQSSGVTANITRLTSDIRHIKGTSRLSGFQEAAVFFSGSLWLHLFPSLLFLLSAGRTQYKRLLLRDPVRRRFREAYMRSLERLARCGTSGGPTGLIAEALTDYIAAKLGTSLTGLTQKEALKQLKEKFSNVPDGHINQIKLLWGELEIQRYAPSNGSTAESDKRLEREVRVLLEALEEVIGR